MSGPTLTAAAGRRYRGRRSCCRRFAQGGSRRRSDDLRQRHAIAGQSRSASGLRRAHAGPDAERLRQSLPLPGRSAEDRAVAGREPHRVGRRPRSGNSSSSPTQVPRRQPAHRRGCGLFSFQRVLALALAPSSAFLKILKPEASPRSIRSPCASSSRRPMRRSSRRSPRSASSIRGSSRPTRRTATGPRPGWPRTAPARAPTRSFRPAIVRWNISTWRSTRITSLAGPTIPSR